MPISDEIIELEPVKKNRTKLITMFIVTGVMIAIAVTFLIMYFLKPAPTEEYGEVLDVDISEASELFSTKDEQGNPTLNASVGHTYKVYASVGTEGSVNSDITWFIEPSKDALSNFTYGRELVSDSKNTQGDEEEGAMYRYYCSFMPNEEYAGQEIKLTARSQSATNKYSEIKFTIVKQGTEYIKLNMYRRGSQGKTTTIDSNAEMPELKLPFYTTQSVRELYYIFFDQLGKYDTSTQTYSKITVDSSIKSNLVEVTSDDTSVIKIDTANPDRFTFSIEKVGEAIITIKANVNNNFGSRSVEKKIKIITESNAKLRYIDGIYFSPVPVTKQFFIDHRNEAVPTGMTDVFTLPYRSSYDAILSHIVLTPYDVQFRYNDDRTDGEMYTDWYDRIGFKPSSNVCTVSSLSGGKRTLTCNGGLASGTECELTISDTSASSIDKPRIIKLNITAQSIMNNAIKLGTVNYVEGTIAQTSQSRDTTLSFTYSLTAPAATDPATMVSYGYLSSGFKFAMKDSSGNNCNFMTVELVGAGSDFKLDYTDPDKIYNFTDKSIDIKHQSSTSQLFTATLTFKLTVNSLASGITDGRYTVAFTKVGWPLTTANGNIERLDNTDTKTITFEVAGVATSASFISESAALALVTDGGNRAGNVKIMGNSAQVFLQNQSQPIPLTELFDLADMFTSSAGSYADGKLIVNSTITSIPIGGAFNPAAAGGKYDQLTFTADTPTAAAQAMILFKLYPNITGGDTEENKLGEFNINIYVIDVVTELSCVVTSHDASPIYYRADMTGDVSEYGGSSNERVRFTVDSLEATYQFGGKQEYRSNDYTVDIAYNTGGIENYALVKSTTPPAGVTGADTQNRQYFYYHPTTGEDILLFSYSPSQRRIRLEADLFIVGCENNIKFNRIVVTYTIPEKSVASGDNYDQPAFSASSRYVLIREADGVTLFGDFDCMTEILKSGASYHYESNQGMEYQDVYVSAIMYKASDTAHNDPFYVTRLVNKDSVEVSPYREVYFTVPDEIYRARTGETPATSTAMRAFTYFQFKAPALSRGDAEVTYSSGAYVYLPGSASPTDLRFKIVNKSRPVAAAASGGLDVSLLRVTDEGDVALSILEFGNHNNTTGSGNVLNPYTKTIKVVIVYDTPGDFTSFASVYLNLPEYLSLSIGGSLVEPISTDNLKISRYELYETDIDNKINYSDTGVTTYTYVVTCTVSLKAGTANNNGNQASDRISVVSPSDPDDVIADAYAYVSTGLRDINYVAYKDDGKGNRTQIANGNVAALQTSGNAIDIRFDLADNIDAQYIYVSYAIVPKSTEYEDFKDSIDYDITGLRLSATTGAGASGLKSSWSMEKGVELGITLRPDLSNLMIMENRQYEFTFYDFATVPNKTKDTVLIGNYTPDATFVLTFNVTVTMDIYNITAPDDFNVRTTGKSDSKLLGFDLYFNDQLSAGQTGLTQQPSATAIGNVGLSIVSKRDGSVTDYTGGKIRPRLATAADYTADPKVNGKKYVIEIDNSLVTGNDYNLCITYKTKTWYVPIYVSTLAHDIRTAAGYVLDSFDQATKTATIYVDDSNETFKLQAEVFNLGSDVTDTTQASDIDYKIYSDSSHTTTSSSVIVNNDGSFRLPYPDGSGTDVLYYRAKYHDDARDIDCYLDVTITYVVTISKIQLEDIKGGIFSDNAITLYYLDNTQYTEIDLSTFITVNTAYTGTTVAIPTTGVVITVDGSSNFVISGNENRTTFSIEAVHSVDGVTIASISREYTVNRVQITAPAFVDNNSRSNPLKVNVVTNSDTELIKELNPNLFICKGLDVTYTVAATANDKNKFIIARDDTNTDQTNINLVRPMLNADDYADAFNPHELSVVATYKQGANCSSRVVGGDMVLTSIYYVTMQWQPPVEATFELQVTKNGSTTGITSGSTVNYDPDATYAFKHIYPTAAWYNHDHWSYKITSSHTDIVTVAEEFTDCVAAVTPKSSYGEVVFTIAATAYGNTKTHTQTYIFAYGANADVTMRKSVDGTNYTLVENDTDKDYATINMDYSSSVVQKRVRYIIDTSKFGMTPELGDIKIFYSGNVSIVTNTVGDDTYNVFRENATSKVFYAEFIADKSDTVLTVSGTVLVSGRTYYTTTRTVKFVTTDPSFKLDMAHSNVGASGATSGTVSSADTNIADSVVVPDMTVGLSITPVAGVYDDYTVSYSILSGGDYATLNATGNALTRQLAFKKNIYTNVRVVVAVTLTVGGGAYNGKTYYFERGITVYGVPLPTLTWNGGANGETILPSLSTTSATGYRSIDFRSGKYTLSTVTVLGKTYSFAAGTTYSYAFSAAPAFVNGQDTLNNRTKDYYAPTDPSATNYGMLTVYDSDKMRAGGTIRLVVTATVNGATISSTPIAQTVTSAVYTVTVTPRPTAQSGVAISGRVGSYDVSKAARLITGTIDGQVKDGDKFVPSFSLVGATGTNISSSNAHEYFEIDSEDPSRLIIKKNVTSTTTVTLSITNVDVTSGAYAGTTLAPAVVSTTTVTVRGFTGNATVEFNASSKSYNTLYLHRDGTGNESLSQVVSKVTGTINKVYVSLITSSASAYVRISNSGALDPSISFDRDFNVFNSTSGTSNKNVEFAVVVETSDGEFYGEFTVAVAPVIAEASYSVQGSTVDSTATPPAMNMVANASLTIVFTESNGLDMGDFTINNLGSYLTGNVSGSNVLIKSSDVPSSQTTTVTISYNIYALDGSVTFSRTQSFNITVSPRASEDAFTVDNLNFTVGKDQPEGTHAGQANLFRTYWTSSNTNPYKTANSVIVNANNLTDRIGAIWFTDDGGSRVDICWDIKRDNRWWADNSTRTLPFNGTYEGKQYNAAAAYTNFHFTIMPLASNTSSFPLKFTYVTTDNTGARVSNEVTYQISFSNNIPITLDLNADGDPTAKVNEERLTHQYKDGSGNIKLYDLTAKYTSGALRGQYKYIPTRMGYDFTGWWVMGVRTMEKVTYGTLVEGMTPGSANNGNKTIYPYTQILYASWQEKTNIKFNYNAGNGKWSDDSSTKTIDQKFKTSVVLPADPTRTGYTFRGWYTMQDGNGQNITTLTEVVTDAETELYAYWTPNSFTPILDLADGHFETAYTAPTITYDANYPDFAAPKRAGYTFGGWYTGANGTGEAITNATGSSKGVVVQVTSAPTLYAKWTANTYKVELDVSATNISDPHHKLYDNNCIHATYDSKYDDLAGITATRTGHTFKGWYTGADGTGVQVTDGNGTLVQTDGNYAIVSVTGQHKLYPKWEANRYSVSFDSAGGSAVSTITDIVYGEHNTYPQLPTPTRTGYTFKGWYTGAGGTGEHITSTTKVKPNDISVIAYWEANSYTVTFILGDKGTVSTATKEVTFASAYGTLPKPTRTGYEFVAWYTDAACTSGNNVAAGSTVTIPGDHNLYASWSARSVTVNYSMLKSTDGTVLTGSTTVFYDSTFAGFATYATNPPNKTFYGWQFTSGANNVVVTDMTTLIDVAHGVVETTGASDPTYSISITAVYTDNIRTVTLNANGGKIMNEDTYGFDVIQGSPLKSVIAMTPERVGYTFVGWTKTQGGSDFVTDATADTVVNNTVLYAKWSANSFTVTFDYKGGEVTTASFTATYGVTTTYPSLPSSTKEGYTFGGWFTSASLGSASQVTGGDAFSWKDDGTPNYTTLYAKWDVESYTISFVDATGTHSRTVTYGTNMESDPTKTGYTFTGWYTAATGGNLVIAPETAKVPDLSGYTKLYAQFTINYYTVNIHLNDGSGNVFTTTAAYDTTVGMLGFTPSRTNYRFDCWKTGATSGTVVDASTRIHADTDAYAQWLETYTVTFNGNGGTITSDSSTTRTLTVYCGEVVTIPAITRIGYTYDGWSGARTIAKTVTNWTVPDLGTAGYSYTLNAKWNACDVAVTVNGSPLSAVKYDAKFSAINIVTATNCFDGSHDNVTGQVTAFKIGNHTIAAADFASTKIDANSGVVKSGDNYSINITALFNYRDIEFDAGDGKIGTESKVTVPNVIDGTSFGDILSNKVVYGSIVPNYTGYTNGGHWYCLDGQFASGKTTSAEITRFYLVWSAVDVRITFVLGGGTFTPAVTEAAIKYNRKFSELIEQLGEPKRDYCDFLGWSYNGGTVDVADFATTPINQAHGVDVTLNAIVLTARWAEKYTVVFESNGTTLRTDANAVKGTTITLPAIPARTGYRTNGWTSDPAGMNISNGKTDFTFNVLDGIEPGETITFSVVWVAKTMTVTYKNGTTTAGTSTSTYDSTYVLYTGATVPTKSGYTFAGWYTASSGGTKVFNADLTPNGNNAIVKTEGNHTLYAHWTAKKVTVTYVDADGHTGPAQVNYDSAFSTLGTPTKEGYTFKGWQVTIDGTTTNISVMSTKINVDSGVTGADGASPAITVEAIWQAVSGD